MSVIKKFIKRGMIKSITPGICWKREIVWHALIRAWSPRHTVKCQISVMHVSQHSIDPCPQGWGHLNQRRKVCVVSDVPRSEDVSIKGGKFVLSQLRLTGIHRHSSAPPSNAAREQGSEHPSVVLWERLSVRVWALSPGWEAFYIELLHGRIPNRVCSSREQLTPSSSTEQ